MEAGFIYFVHADLTNRYKIGLTNNLDRRMKELNGKQSPFKNNLLWSIKVCDMRSAEKDLHDRFHSRRVNGEWFQFAESELGEVESIYDRVADEYLIKRYHHTPAVQYEPDSAHPYGSGGSGCLNACLAGGAIVAGLIFAAMQGIEMPRFNMPTIATALTATTTRRANVRTVPNGKIICVLEAKKQIEISSSDQDGWHKTTACSGSAGVIHNSVISK